MKKIVFFLFLCFHAISLVAQVVTVKSIKNVPLAGIIIWNQDSSTVVTTNLNGQAELEQFIAHKPIYIGGKGYETVEKNKFQLSKEGFVVFLNPKAVRLSEVIISANRFNENIATCPSQMEIVKSRTIEFNNAQTTADLLASTGNIMVQKSQMGGGSPILRGFEANKVLLVVDGIRMNNAIYRSGHLQNSITMGSNTIDRIEVLYGPRSTMYGSDAFGGMVYFKTKDPKLALTSNKLLQTGAFFRAGTANGEKTLNFDFNLANKKLGAYTNITYSSFGDLKQGKNRSAAIGDLGLRPFYQSRDTAHLLLTNPDPSKQVSSSYSQFDLMQKLLYQSSSSTQHILNFQYSTSSIVPRYDRLSEFRNGSPRFNKWQYGPQDRLLLAYHLNLNRKTALTEKIKITLSHQQIEESRITQRWYSPVITTQNEAVKVSALNIDIDKTTGKHDVVYGLEAFTNNVQSSASWQTDSSLSINQALSRYPDGGSTYNGFAVYITDDYKIAKGLNLNIGARYNRYNLQSKFGFSRATFDFLPTIFNQNNNALSGNLGIIYNPKLNNKYYINFSTGYRAPNVDDIGKVFESVSGNVIIPNTNLKPERINTLEIGLSQDFAKNHSLSANVYYNQISDLITTGNAQLNGKDSIDYQGQLSKVTTSINADEAYSYGLSTGYKYHINQTWQIEINYNYIFGRIKTDTSDYPLDHITPAFGRATTTYSKGRLKLEAYCLFSAAKKLDDYNFIGEDNFNYATPNGMPAWYTLNMRSSYKLNTYFEMQFMIENILDYNYRVFASGISAAGRNYTFTLRYHLP